MDASNLLMTPILRLASIKKSYGTFVAVDDIELSVRQGEFLTVLGPSGCGKSTTLRMIGGMERPSHGHIEINGSRVDHLPSYKRDTATVFQSGALFPHLTVWDNMAYGLRMRRTHATEIHRRVNEMLAVVQMTDFANRYPGEMSGGQRQRVALARALVLRPSILLLDEPMSALDLKLKVELRSEIRRLHSELGFTAILVTHDQGEAMSLSDRVAIMNMGRIEQIGTPVEIYERPLSEFVYRFVGESCSMTIDAGDTYDGTLDLVDRPTSGRHRLFVRPQKLAILDGSGADNSIRGRVVATEYLGGLHRVHVETLAGDLFVDLDKTPSVRTDESVTLGWASGDATLFGVQ